MKKLALSLTIIAAGLSMVAADAAAQRIVVETPALASRSSNIEATAALATSLPS